MALQDRDSASDFDGRRGVGKPGGDWQGVRPSLDNPMTWALPIGRIWGIAVRVHVLFLVYVLIRLSRAGLGAQDASESVALGFQIAAIWLASLFVLVLLHELGHCAACRLAHGDADEILLWPLGGLAYCHPPDRWSAHLGTALGGPMVNVLVCALLTPALGLATGQWWGVAIPDPLNLGMPAAVAGSWTWITIYLANSASFILLWFNLLPVFPLDGGRMLQACLWPRMGYVASMRVAVRAGYVGAIVLGVLGAAKGNLTLVAVAFFGGLTCWHTHRQLQFTQETLGFEGEPEAEAARPRRPSRADRRAARRRQREQIEAEQLDRVLQKIAARGMGSLTRAERRLLHRATERQRHARQHHD